MKRNVLLSKYTTFKIGGPAKYFFEVKDKKELISAVKFAKEKGLPFFILGGGSNLLVSDKGFKGVVINFQFSIFNFQSISNFQFSIFNLFEPVLAFIQKKYMSNRRTSEKIESHRLMFHPEDKREWVMREYLKKVKNIRF